MRQAGSLPNESDAKRFVDYLLTVGIEAKADAAGEGYAIWIFDENQLTQSKAALQEFSLNPQDAKYADVAKQAETRRREVQARQKAAGRNIINVRNRWSTPGRRGPRPVTFFLIGVCLVVAAITKFGTDKKPIQPYLYMTALSSEPRVPSDEEIERISEKLGTRDLSKYPRALESLFGYYDDSLPEIRHGQIWRLFTPMFIHSDILHLLFNMWMLFTLGGVIEDRYGSGWLIVLVLVTDLIANLCQYYWQGPIFGGMSGVNYALFGYAWMKSKFDPAAGFRISERTVFVLLVWLVICFTGWVGPIANAAHVGGLIAGLVFGYAPLLIRR
jgi:GlpG protein